MLILFSKEEKSFPRGLNPSEKVSLRRAAGNGRPSPEARQVTPRWPLSHVAPVGAVLLPLPKDHARDAHPWALGAFHVLGQQEELKSQDSAPVSGRDNLTAAGRSLESQSLPRTSARALLPFLCA